MRIDLREWVRYGIVLLAGIIAGGRTVGAWQAYRKSLALREVDPSGADAYRTFAQVDLAVALSCLAVAVLVWWLLRPRLERKEKPR